MKAPNIQFCTENGRFEVNENICTTFTAYHQESWLPTWNIKNIIIGLRSMFSEDTPGAIASIVCSDDARKMFSAKSVTYKCKICGCDHSKLHLSDDILMPKSPLVSNQVLN